MNEKDAIKLIMKEKKMNQQTMAKSMGYSAQGAVSRLLSDVTKTMTVSTVTGMLDVLGCDLIIRDRSNGKEYVIFEGESKMDVMQKKIEEMQRRIDELEAAADAGDRE